MTPAVALAILAAGLAVALAIALSALVRRPRPVDPSESFAPAMAALQQALGGIQQSVGAISQGLESRLQTQGAALDRQLDAVRQSLGAASQTLTALRQRQEDSHLAMARVERVIAGTQAKGAAGEALVLSQIQALPPEMLEINFATPRGVVEYALRLPDGKRLPVDAKFPATDALERLSQTGITDDERDKLAKTVRAKVRDMAEEVSKYRDPALTTGEAICAVPDAAFAMTGKLAYQCYRELGVTLMPFSMLLPFLLAYYRRYASQMQMNSHELAAYLQQLDAVEQHLAQMEDTLKNSVDRPVTALGNAARDLRDRIAEVRRIVQARPALTGSEPSALPAGQDRPR